jgi:hypothetical protein
MSLNFEDGKPIAKLGKQMVYQTSKPDTVDGRSSLQITRGDNVFEHAIDDETERTIGYITGASGSGKSYYVKNYIEAYHKRYPKRDVYVFSALDDCATLDKLKYLKRIKIKQEPFLTTDLSAKDFKDSLVIFDDTDVISNKAIKKKVMDIQNSILETGRHFCASALVTSHVACAGNDTKKILNEAHFITVFPRNLGGKMCKYLFDSYMGLDKNEIQRIKNMQGRAVTIFKSYPMLIMGEREIFEKGSE